MLTKNFRNNTDEEIAKNAYYLNNEEVKTGCVKYCVVIMHTDNEGNTFSLDQFLVTETLYCCIYIMFKVIQRWKFSLQVWVIMKKKGADNKIIIIKLDCNMIQDRNVTVKLLSPGHLSSSIQHIVKMQQINDEGHIYWVNVLFNLIEVLSDWLWVNFAELIKLNFILQKLWEIFISSTLELYVRSLMSITEFVKEFLNIVQQKRVIDSLNAWHLAHSDKHFVQLNQTASAEEWPAIKLSPQTSFLTVAEWVTVMKYEAIAEQEVTANQATSIKGFIFALQAIIISEEEKRCYMALIDGLQKMPLWFDSEKMLKVNFNAEVDDHEKDWSGVVVQQLSFAQIDQTIIVLHKLWDKKKNIYKGESLKTISHNFKTDKKFKAQCQMSDKMIVKIWVILQEKALKHQINALSAFQQTQDDLHHVIHSSNYTQAQSRDIFIIISLDAVKDWIDVLKLTPSQRKAMIYCCELSYEIDIIQEPSGMSKSHWCTEMIQSFLHSDNDELHQVLVIIFTNDTVDELVEKIKTSALKNPQTEDKIIIHLHVIFSEQNIIWNKVKGSRDPLSLIINEDELDVLAEFDIVKTIYEVYKGTDQSKSIVMNKRVQLIEHSLTTWMLQVADVILYPVSDSDSWKGFWEYYNLYSEDDMNATQQIEFRKILTNLQKHVLHAVSVVVCIINNTDTVKLFTIFRLTVIFMNKVTKIIESDAIITLMHYASASVVMIEDHKQLKPIVLSCKGSSEQFVAQMIMSFFTWLVQLGHSLIMFTEQHWMSPEIFKIDSIIFYNGQLINATITQLVSCSLSLKIKNFIKGVYQVENLILMIDVKDTTEQIENSQCNLVNATVCMNMMKTLLKTFESKHLAIISLYWAQQKVYYHALYQLQSKLKKKDLRAIQNKIIDSFQENEADIIILNLVITKKLGFTQEMNQLNIALTQAWDDLMMITDVSVNKSQNNKGFAHWLRKLISFFKQSRLVQQIKNMLKNLNVSKFIDIKPKDVQEDVPATETEQILTLNLTLATAEGVIMQSDTLVVNEGTTTQLNASVVNWSATVELNASNIDWGVNVKPNASINW